jgi:hypothetical protein
MFGAEAKRKLHVVQPLERVDLLTSLKGVGSPQLKLNGFDYINEPLSTDFHKSIADCDRSLFQIEEDGSVNPEYICICDEQYTYDINSPIDSTHGRCVLEVVDDVFDAIEDVVEDASKVVKELTFKKLHVYLTKMDVEILSCALVLLLAMFYTKPILRVLLYAIWCTSSLSELAMMMFSGLTFGFSMVMGQVLSVLFTTVYITGIALHFVFIKPFIVTFKAIHWIVKNGFGVVMSMIRRTLLFFLIGIFGLPKICLDRRNDMYTIIERRSRCFIDCKCHTCKANFVCECEEPVCICVCKCICPDKQVDLECKCECTDVIHSDCDCLCLYTHVDCLCVCPLDHTDCLCDCVDTQNSSCKR